MVFDEYCIPNPVISVYSVPGLISMDGINELTVIKEVAKVMNINYRDMFKKVRTREIVDSRHIVYYILSIYTKISLSKIGATFKSDHTTVIHGREKIRGLISVDKSMAIVIQKIKNNLGIYENTGVREKK